MDISFEKTEENCITEEMVNLLMKHLKIKNISKFLTTLKKEIEQ
jgi:hypothetical protein